MHFIFYRKKFFFILTSLFLISATLTSCAVPKAQRYKNIEAVKEQIDYKNLGTILKEEYDTGDGVFSPSYFKVIISGDADTFEELEHQFRSIKYSSCTGGGESLYLQCNVATVSVNLAGGNNSPETEVTFQITDSMNGRS